MCMAENVKTVHREREARLGRRRGGGGEAVEEILIGRFHYIYTYF